MHLTFIKVDSQGRVDALNLGIEQKNHPYANKKQNIYSPKAVGQWHTIRRRCENENENGEDDTQLSLIKDFFQEVDTSIYNCIQKYPS